MSGTRFIENISGVLLHLERRICTHILSVAASALLLRSIFPFNMSSYYERHAFYRKHFWCFSTFRTKDIHIYLVLLLEHTCYDRYSHSNKYYEPHTFYRKHFWCFSTFRMKNIHIYLVCCSQSTLATIDTPF